MNKKEFEKHLWGNNDKVTCVSSSIIHPTISGGPFKIAAIDFDLGIIKIKDDNKYHFTHYKYCKLYNELKTIDHYSV